MNDESKFNEVKHDCELQLDDDVLYNYIKTGIFVEFRRKMKKASLISELHPTSKLHFRSMYAIRVEQLRHLKDYYYTIHPLSKVNLMRERWMIIVYILVYILAPFCMMLNDPIVDIIRVIFDVLCIIDFALTMNIGYIIETSNKIILQRRKIWRHKFVPAFLFDFLSSIHVELLGLTNFFPSYIRLEFLLVLKYFRFLTLLSYVDRYFEQTRCSFKTVTILKLVLLSIIVCIWCSLAINIVDKYTGENLLANTTDAYFIFVCYQEALFLLLLFGSKRKVDFLFAIMEIIILTIGVIFHLIVISQLVQILRFTGSHNAFYKMTQQLDQFMRFRNLPAALRKRLRTYFYFRFQEDYYKEAAILEMISPQLHQEMLLHTHMYLLEKSTIFYDLPIQLMSRIISYLRAEIYLPSDIIVTAGTLGDCMYFLASGTVAVYTPAGKELCHLSDGTSFGELSMVMENENRIANVVAIDNCQIFLLNRKDFTREVEDYPDVYERIRLLVQDKVRMTLIGSLEGDASSEQLSNHSLRSRQISSGYIRI